MWESLEGSAQTAKAVARCAVCTVIQNEVILSDSGRETRPSFSVSSAPSGLRHQQLAYSRTRR